MLQFGPLRLCQLSGQQRQDCLIVGGNPIVGHLENRRFGALVDRDDQAGAAHADRVLERAAQRYRDVKAGRDGPSLDPHGVTVAFQQ